MAVLPLLADPQSYVACEWDLLTDPAGREYWLDVFRNHIDTLVRSAIASGATQEQCAIVRKNLTAYLDEIEKNPSVQGNHLDIISLDKVRTKALHDAGIHDAFRAAKERETKAALLQLPDRLKFLDSLTRTERQVELIRGIFAGNFFDMGAVSIAEQYVDDNGNTFSQALSQVRSRPWLIDHADDLDPQHHNKILMFVDNAGGDIVLGMLPLARELARNGAVVTLAANSDPALNDVTHEELVTLLDKSTGLDAVIDRLRTEQKLRTVPTGTGAPLINLAEIGSELTQSAQGTDLLILEGMGRALESNFSAKFTCETWSFAVIKDKGVARRFGGSMFDCICRLRPPFS